MSAEKQDSTRPKRPGPDKAEFTVKEKPVKLEKAPELEAELAGGQPGKAATKASPGSEQQAQPPQPVPFQFSDVGPLLDMAGGKWNEYLVGPTVDERGRYLWTGEDTKNIVNALTALDNKYHFSANWLQYWPEVFTLIVVAGIIAKLVMGARWKDQQKKQAVAQAENPVPGPTQSVQPAAAKPASEKTPADLKVDISETLKKFGVTDDTVPA